MAISQPPEIHTTRVAALATRMLGRTAFPMVNLEKAREDGGLRICVWHEENGKRVPHVLATGHTWEECFEKLGPR